MNVGTERHAVLLSIVELLAPGIEEVRERLKEALEDADWDEYSPTDALIDALYDAEAFYDNSSGLAYFDWKANPQELRDDLQQLPTCPRELAWDWYDWTESTKWDPDDLDDFLWPLAERCNELGVAIVSVFVDGDGFTLGFLPVTRLDELRKQSAAVGAQIDIIRPGEPTV
ncbi:hypothetical protein ACFWFQ_33165 [Nocardia salmonicida]|uniref:DUF6630 family protein n=1 Tax=Nocardia salmonicida TaxID=53431 RepID=UPI00364B2C0C